MESILTKKQFRKGETIVNEGAESYNVYIVTDGEATVIKSSFGNDIIVRVLKEGDVFGALSLIANAPRAATVIAKTDIEVGMIYKDDFEGMLKKLPSDINDILREMMDELKANYELSAELVQLTTKMLGIKGRMKAIKRKEIKEALDEIPDVYRTIFVSLDESLTNMVHNFYTLATQLDKTVVEVDNLFQRSFGKGTAKTS